MPYAPCAMLIHAQQELSMTKKSLNLLKKLTAAHSTPGDESAVADLLKAHWKKAGWKTTAHGSYAISAKRTASSGKRRPRLLVCAHMDSPGFIVDRREWTLCKRRKIAQIHISALGHPCFKESAVQGQLKCRNGIFQGIIRKKESDYEPEYHLEMPIDEAQKTDLCIGDRVCYGAGFSIDDELINSPFLDNRLGCWMLTRLAGLRDGWNKRYDIVLGAAGSEEMTGFGALILAAEVKADLVIVLDATYEAKEQGVFIGNGAVVTLSDKSVLVSMDERDRIMQMMSEADIPIQFEAYNFSGTDSRAFPQQGKPVPVIALLLPTRGNHSPCETASIKDVENWEKAIKALEKYF